MRDWIEKKLGDASLGPESDPDLDGFTLATELKYGFSLQLKDSRSKGGISRHRSTVIAVGLGGGGVVTTRSDPEGLIEASSTPVESAETFATVTAPQTHGDKRFLYWVRNGQIIRGQGGVPLPRITEDGVTSGVNLVAKYADKGMDSDGDGLPDWFELRSNSDDPNADPDEDGFSFAFERKYGFSPHLKDLRSIGGVTRRRSKVVDLSPEKESSDDLNSLKDKLAELEKQIDGLSRKSS